MFTLRRFSSSGIQMNNIVGDNYTYIHQERNPEDFRKTFKAFNNMEYKDAPDNDCYAFVCNGAFVQPLYKNQKSFIMTSGGKTFANVSYK